MRQKPTQQDKAIILGLKLSTFKIQKRTNENVLTFPYLISKAIKFRKGFIQDPKSFFFLWGRREQRLNFRPLEFLFEILLGFFVT